jgi:hypothetical protein
MPLGSVNLSIEAHQIKVINTSPIKNMRADEIAIKTATTGKVTAVVAVMSIFFRKRCNVQSTIPGNKKPSCQKAESDNFLEEISHELRNLYQKTRKGWILKKLAPKLKRLELNSTNLKLNCKKSCLDCAKKPDPSLSYGPRVKN